ncbi:MAG: zinc-ribbon domain-containing protein [Clostridia bacterium]|nr:zinc-ribbon domain-containing protein [Clostridia bacterium]
MFCSKCGKEIMDEAVICPHCGCSTRSGPPTSIDEDAPSPGFAILGFFVPIVGVILNGCFISRHPLRARSARRGAIIGIFFWIIVSAAFGFNYY